MLTKWCFFFFVFNVKFYNKPANITVSELIVFAKLPEPICLALAVTVHFTTHPVTARLAQRVRWQFQLAPFSVEQRETSA